MTRDELKQKCIDKAGEALDNGNMDDANNCVSMCVSLEKNDIQAEKNGADYELSKEKMENEVSMETYKVDKETEVEKMSILQRAKAACLEHWTKFAGAIGAAVAIEVIRGLVKRYICKTVIYAEKHDDMYINGNKYSDKQF